ncbi:603_t:CDS:2 [Funneliformis mosseae]|uniref:603_t:CDS:1 n=1 Tax=Funneliformis mosseae TaxID=27381 RepID=A0A9N8WHC8_FUNMO|nr:603_t:CDS:2 [Funneliformis mosseae]
MNANKSSNRNNTTDDVIPPNQFLDEIDAPVFVFVCISDNKQYGPHHNDLARVTKSWPALCFKKLLLNFGGIQEKVGERESETKANINNLEEKVREREETKGIIKNLEEKVKEETKAKQVIINNLEEKIRVREESNNYPT